MRHDCHERRGWQLQRWQLFKAADEKKEQSYALYMLTQEQLRCLCLMMKEMFYPKKQ